MDINCNEAKFEQAFTLHLAYFTIGICLFVLVGTFCVYELDRTRAKLHG